MAKNEIAEKIYGNPDWVDGRINRREYLLRSFKYALLIVGMIVVAGATYLLARGGTIGITLAGICGLLALLFYWRLLMGSVKRLHDLNFSGWWVILLLGVADYSYTIDGTQVSFNPANYLLGDFFGDIFSIIGLVFWLLLALKRGTVGFNKYGKDPLTKYEGDK